MFDIEVNRDEWTQRFTETNVQVIIEIKVNVDVNSNIRYLSLKKKKKCNLFKFYLSCVYSSLEIYTHLLYGL